jgi:hypothetical protein
MLRTTLFSLAALCGLIFIAGCSHKDGGGGQASAMDVCPDCPGVQTKVNSDGTCAACGKKVDYCLHCPGIQKPDAKGECPMCHMKVADMGPSTRPSTP